MIDDESAPAAATPASRRPLGTPQATLVALGMVLSTDMLKTAPVVASHVAAGSELWLWLAGGLASLIGALCYAEMAASFPERGGEYAFLRRAWGQRLATLYGWSRFAVLHTGWIALMAHLLADYAAALFPLAGWRHDALALLVVAALVGINLGHVRLGLGTQAALVGTVVAGFGAVALAGVMVTPPVAPPAAMAVTPQPGQGPGIGPALIYVLLAYGGWSDMATLAGELRAGPRAAPRMIVGAMLTLTSLYLLLNAMLLHGLGRAGLIASTAPGADLAAAAFGPAGAVLVVGVVVIAAVASINSTLIVCARVTAAACADHPALGAVGQWHATRAIPARATLAVGGCAAVLTVLAGRTGNGFGAMVDYMTPVYWLFACLGIAATVQLRRRFPDVARPLRTPLFPLFPLAFLALGLTMLVSSLTQLGPGAGAGAVMLGVGAVLDTALRTRSAAIARGARAS